ncbi:hypothetical protein [Bradyrhizobium sp. JR18.2]
MEKPTEPEFLVSAAIPKKYRAVFGDRAEIKISLGTTDYDDACVVK